MDIDIHKVSSLARIELTADEEEHLGAQLAGILDYIAQLDELDTESVEPTSHAVPLDTPFREDEVGEQLTRKQALANAPDQDGIAFVVPKVL